MKRSEFYKLTKDMQDAFNEYRSFMDHFISTIQREQPRRIKPVMTASDLATARRLKEQSDRLEDAWLTFVRSSEEVEDD